MMTDELKSNTELDIQWDSLNRTEAKVEVNETEVESEYQILSCAKAWNTSSHMI